MTFGTGDLTREHCINDCNNIEIVDHIQGIYKLFLPISRVILTDNQDRSQEQVHVYVLIAV